MAIGAFELILLISLAISVFWVWSDAPKYGINKYVAIVAIIVLIYPIGFIGYLIVTRLFRRKISKD